MKHAGELEALVRGSASLMAVLEAARSLGLPDWLVFSGAVYQKVLNHLTGRPDGHGLKDYDLGYFDPDTSWEAEDRVIRRAAGSLPPPLDRLVEVRNQARVHLSASPTPPCPAPPRPSAALSRRPSRWG